MTQPLYQQLAQHYLQAIESGSLRTGDRFPSVRRIMATQGVSMSTAVLVCHTLEDMGHLQARARSGYYVQAAPRARLLPPNEWAQAQVKRVVREADYQGLHRFVAEWIAAVEEGPVHINFMTVAGAPELYPHAQLARLASSALRQDPLLLTTMSRRYGHPQLRAVLARRALQRGMQLQAGGITITNGCIEALNLALRAVCQPGDTVAVESPTFYGILQTIESLSLKALELPTSPTAGLSLEALEMALDDPQTRIAAVLVQPTLHNPLGCTMPDAAKAALVALCARHQVPLIEDDIYADTGRQHMLVRPAKAWDAEGGVIHCGSLHKSLAPGMRLGWMAAGRWQARVEMLKYTQSRFQEELGQVVAARFMESAAYDRFLTRFQAVLRERRQTAADAIAQHWPAGVRVSTTEGGMLLWAELPEGCSGAQLARDGLAQGIALAPGEMFSSQPRMRRFVRISVGAATPEQIVQGLRLLGSSLYRQLVAGDAPADVNDHQK
jgi:DNA-binding transcriptional MocR family regulator